MNLTLSVSVYDNQGQNYVDPDVIPTLGLLSDPYGVERFDTHEVIVAPGTVMNPVAQGRFQYVIVGALPGITYHYFPIIILNGETLSPEKFVTPQGNTWYYGDQQDVQDIVGDKMLTALSNFNLEAATTIDSAAVQRAGIWADGEIDKYAAMGGYATPLVYNGGALVDWSASALADASARLVIYKLLEPRILASASRMPGSEEDAGDADELLAVLREHRKNAYDFLGQISRRSVPLKADKIFAQKPTAVVRVPACRQRSWWWCDSRYEIVCAA